MITLKSKVKNLLSSFRSVSLAEMDEAKLMDRYDTKFLLSEEQFLEILPQLIEEYRILEIESKRSFTYESVYLDDVNFSFFNDHHAGKTHRFKVRYRTYVDVGSSFLEVKERIKGHTVKKRIPANGTFDFQTNEEKEFVAALLTQTKALFPVLKNSYQRITLVSNNGTERLTFDFELVYKWNEKESLFAGLVIAELKQEKVNRNAPFYKMMKQRIIRPLRVSKYCLGIMRLYMDKGLKFNRFKSKILKINKLEAHAA
jgi:hypothetical protein